MCRANTVRRQTAAREVWTQRWLTLTLGRFTLNKRPRLSEKDKGWIVLLLLSTEPPALRNV